MKRHHARLFAAVLTLSAPALAAADIITDYNALTLQTIRTLGVNPPRASRAMAMVHLGIYDAVNSIDRTHQPYIGFVAGAAGASREAAAAQAGCDVLTALFPSQAGAFTSNLQAQLAGIPDGPAKTAGLAVGAAAAQGIIAARANDGSGNVTPYVPGTLPGQWRPTPAGFAPALLPNWPTVTPFGLSSGSQFRPAGPPALASAEYAAAVNEVQAIGAANSTTRTQDQTDIARFWADGGGTSTPPGHWNRIAATVSQARGLSVSENARLFALLNIATADSAIAAWDAKYETNFWRPITAIREADTDGNPATTADPSWTPLIATPPFPTYVSGHSSFSAASALILAGFFGTDNVAFTTSAEGFAVADRSFTSFSQAAQEAALSRLYGGIHFSFDNNVGLLLGEQVGAFVFQNYLGVIPSPGGVMLLTIASPAVVRRGRTA